MNKTRNGTVGSSAYSSFVALQVRGGRVFMTNADCSFEIIVIMNNIVNFASLSVIGSENSSDKC